MKKMKKKNILKDVTCKLRLCICRSLGSAFCLWVNFLRPPLNLKVKLVPVDVFMALVSEGTHRDISKENKSPLMNVPPPPLQF